ncbi:hypothetical protein [Streptomyces sp. R33]|uniref:Uncharacterized protein n=1 Tax=Streptomyces sp. R33 TaxID=3238629 RepID=A0AB39YKU9_9ACTN
MAEIRRSVGAGRGGAAAARQGRYPDQLRAQFEGLVWRLRTSAKWREMLSAVYGRFWAWRVGVSNSTPSSSPPAIVNERP